MAGNINPIFSRQGDVVGSALLTTAANDYTGQNVNNTILYIADSTNGSFIQRLRFKPIGTNVATVARVFINNGNASPRAPVISAVSGTPTGTAGGSATTIQAGSFFAKIYAVDQFGSITAASTESAGVAATAGQNITWNWTAATGAASYIIAVGLATGAQVAIFTATTNTFVQTVPGTIAIGNITLQNYFVGEISLPATTISAIVGLPDIDYALNMPLAPKQAILVGLGTTVAAGWTVTAIGGKY